MDEKEYPILESIEKLSDVDQPTAYHAELELKEACWAAMSPSGADKRAHLAKTFVDALTAMVTPEPPADEPDKKMEPHPKYDRDTRNKLLRFLAHVGGPEQVPAIQGVIGDLELREMARYALEGIGGDAAVTALIETLDKSTGPIFRIGVMNTLAHSGRPEALKTLKQMSNDPDLDVRLAAVEGLACFADPSVDALIVRATRVAKPRHRKRAFAARVRLAGTLMDAGKKRPAMRIYRALAAKPAPHAKAAKLALEPAK
jgi:hypothetical protein